MKKSGLQKEILALYRTVLRAVRLKPEENRTSFKQYARYQFDKYKNIDHKDFNTIEFLLRKGKRQLEIYSGEGIKNVKFN
ncbi:hypothetical protein K502DRAFT_306962 [Neoconidiobolus thromboides FSU 785]|nr:hypothetical protein K502DRAFT_306962 [Neoconidiobolus thromboides FSU 785]